uniref:Cadherin domain-containing protein n=1 Tax=Meloidogyne incognita TaxID=6306 RepID=A0A914LD53_MELIC
MNLSPGERLRVEWTVVPVPEFRLTGPILQKIDLTFAYQLGGRRLAQRLNSPSIKILPQPSLRLLAFGQPTIPTSLPGSPPFSLMLSAINSGYSTLKMVQLLELRPNFSLIGNENRQSSIDFKIDGINLESLKELGNEGMAESLSFGQIKSGEASHLFLNISLEYNDDRQYKIEKSALFRSFSAVVSVDGSLLPPGQFEQKFFLIHETTHNHAMLIVSEYSNPFPLYLFSKRHNSLTPLTTLQLIEEKESRPQINGHSFLTRIFALRRLSLISTSQEDENLRSSVGAIFASVNVGTAQTFENGAKLLRVAEIGPQGRRRPINMSLVWIGRISNEKTTLINFIDLRASPAIPQLIYELLFGLPEHFNLPFFSQPFYQLNLALPVKTNGKQKVLARMEAISPTNKQIKYSLLTTQMNSTLSIVPSTGDIVLSDDLLEPYEYCLNVVATDSEGQSSRVPFQLNILKRENEGMEEQCQLFNEESNNLYNNEFKPIEKQKEEKDFFYFTSTTTTIQLTNNKIEEEKITTIPLIISSEPSISAKPIFVHKIVGDSTLSPLTTLKGKLATVGDSLLENELKGNETENIYSLASTSILPPLEESPLNNLRTVQPHRFSTRQQSGSLKIAGLSGGGVGTRIGQNNGRKINGSSIQRESKGDMASQASATTMAEMACRLRSTKPIWALICDMAKTVYRSTMINA